MKQLGSNQLSRRRLFAVAGLSAGAALLTPNTLFAESIESLSDGDQKQDVPAKERGVSTSFGSIKQIDVGVLNIGYAEVGPSDGPVIILLHGWPYDIHSFVDVAPFLASKGYRVIVPFLRGYGATRFLSSGTFRNGQQSVLAQDIIRLMDALRIQQAILAGFDWERGQLTSWQSCGLSDARRSSQSAATSSAALKPTRSPCLPKQNSRDGTSITSPQSVAGLVMSNIVAILLGSFGRSLRPNGISMMQHSIVQRPPSII